MKIEVGDVVELNNGDVALPYRINPEPVRETVTLMIDDGSMGGPRAIGTIDLNDGEPDRSSIKIGED